MFTTPSREALWIFLLAWGVLFGILIVGTWKSRRRGIGLPLAYVFGFSLIHCPGALCYAVPGYSPRSQILVDIGSSLSNTFAGFRLTLIGFAALVVGWFLANSFVSSNVRLEARTLNPEISAKMPRRLLVWSFLFFFFIAPIFRLIPSMGSLGTAGTGLSVVAATLGCWQAWDRGDRKRLLWWFVGSTLCFPLMTLTFLGFMSFGVAAALVIWFFTFAFYRPRWVALAALITLTYGGLTLYVNYMRERESIRHSVWGQRQLSNRLDRMSKVIVNFEFLNLYKQQHLEYIDSRLNQNQLIGMCQNYLEHSTVGHAHGETLYLAAVSMVPRIFWPGKPTTGGGGYVVRKYTGMSFGETTSVGVGQVMEFYINFGTGFVVFGMLAMGYVLRWFDIRAGHYLYQRDYWSYTRWLIPSLGLLMPQGNLAEITGSLAAGGVFVYVLHHMFFKDYYLRGIPVGRGRQKRVYGRYTRLPDVNPSDEAKS